jgi:hypothetical protein
MKNLFLTIAFVFATVSLVNANTSVISSSLKKESSIKRCLTYEKSLNIEVEYNYKYIYYGVGCYANIYYNGELVGTVYSYETGDTKAEATANCYAVAKARAHEFIKAAE